MLKRTPTIALEIDWFYRKGGALLYRVLDVTLNGLNAACAKTTSGIVDSLAALFADLPERLAATGARLAGLLSGKPKAVRDADAQRAQKCLATS